MTGDSTTVILSTRRIQSTKGHTNLRLNELWQYRELLYFLIWRDITVRYKQTVLGFTWAIIQPFTTMVVFSIFFGGLAKIPSDGIPYPLFTFTALVPWTLFSGGLARASDSLIGSAGLFTKVYFPRLIIPISAVVSGIVDFTIAFVILLGMLLFYQRTPTLNIIWLPFYVLLIITLALGMGLWLSALNVRYRDVRYLVPFLTQLWLYATPVAYPTSLINSPVLRVIYGLNPMAGVVEGFRWALIGSDTPPGPMLWVSVTIVFVLLISGAWCFRNLERTFADLV